MANMRARIYGEGREEDEKGEIVHAWTVGLYGKGERER